MERKLLECEVDEILADIVLATGDFAESERVYRRVLSEKEKFYGQDHPEVARMLANLALALFYMNRNAESDEALGRSEKILGSLSTADDAVFGAKSVIAKLHRRNAGNASSISTMPAGAHRWSG